MTTEIEAREALEYHAEMEADFGGFHALICDGGANLLGEKLWVVYLKPSEGIGFKRHMPTLVLEGRAGTPEIDQWLKIGRPSSNIVSLYRKPGIADNHADQWLAHGWKE